MFRFQVKETPSFSQMVVLVLGVILFNVMWIAAVGYVVVHFLRKYW